MIFKAVSRGSGQYPSVYRISGGNYNSYDQHITLRALYGGEVDSMIAVPKSEFMAAAGRSKTVVVFYMGSAYSDWFTVIGEKEIGRPASGSFSLLQQIPGSTLFSLYNGALEEEYIFETATNYIKNQQCKDPLAASCLVINDAISTTCKDHSHLETYEGNTPICRCDKYFTQVDNGSQGSSCEICNKNLHCIGTAVSDNVDIPHILEIYRDNFYGAHAIDISLFSRETQGSTPNVVERGYVYHSGKKLVTNYYNSDTQEYYNF